MGFSKVRTGATYKGGLMKVGSLYSCKWTPFHSNDERGWDMLMLVKVDYVGDEVGRYVFYDLIHGAKRSISASLARHCKEITKETKCTQ